MNIPFETDKAKKMRFFRKAKKLFNATDTSRTEHWLLLKTVSKRNHLELSLSPVTGQISLFFETETDNDLFSSTMDKPFEECLEIWRNNLTNSIARNKLTDFRSKIILTALLAEENEETGSPA